MKTLLLLLVMVGFQLSCCQSKQPFSVTMGTEELSRAQLQEESDDAYRSLPEIVGHHWERAGVSIMELHDNDGRIVADLMVDFGEGARVCGLEPDHQGCPWFASNKAAGAWMRKMYSGGAR